MITLMNARIQIFLSTDHAMEMNGQKYTPASHRGADPHEALSIGDASVLADNLPVGTRPISTKYHQMCVAGKPPFLHRGSERSLEWAPRIGSLKPAT